MYSVFIFLFRSVHLLFSNRFSSYVCMYVCMYVSRCALEAVHRCMYINRVLARIKLKRGGGFEIKAYLWF